MRRLRALPSRVTLSATGSYSPMPSGVSRSASTLRAISCARTASARILDRARLASSSPSLSVWPMIWTRTPGLATRKSAISSRVGRDSSVMRSPPLSNWIGVRAAAALRRAWSSRSAWLAGRSGASSSGTVSVTIGSGTRTRFSTPITPGSACATRVAASRSSSEATRPRSTTVQSTTCTSTVGRPARTMAAWTVAERSCCSSTGSSVAVPPMAMTTKKATRRRTSRRVRRSARRSPRRLRRGRPLRRRPAPKPGPMLRPRRSRGSRIQPVTGGTGGRGGRRCPPACPIGRRVRRAPGSDLGQGGDDLLAEPGQRLLGVPPEEEAGHHEAGDALGGQLGGPLDR